MYFHRKRVLLYFGAPLLCVLVLVLLFCVAGAIGHLVDFRTYYAAGRIVGAGDGAHLYNYEAQRIAQGTIGHANPINMRFMAPPFAALLFIPFTWLGFVPGYTAFLCFDFLLVILAARAISPWLPVVRTMVGPPWLLFLTFFPVDMALGQGQPTLIVFALLCFAYVCLQHGRHVVAGLLLSLALIKFQIVLPVVLLFLLWRRWAVVGGFLLGTIPLSLISLLVIQLDRPTRLASFLAGLPHTASVVITELGRGTHPESMPNLYGLLYFLTAHRTGLLLSIVLSLVLLFWASRQPASLPLAILVAMLVSNHLYVHDLSPAILPLALLLERLLATGRSAFIKPNSPTDWQFIACWSSLAILLAAPLVLVLMGDGVLPLIVVPLGIITFLFPQIGSPALTETPGSENVLHQSAVAI